MNNITISLSNDRIKELKEKSSRLGLTLEELVLLSIDEILSRPDQEFRQMMEYVLQKNTELYQRLA
jgi:undecaprenyl pyrophosphate synthase